MIEGVGPSWDYNGRSTSSSNKSSNIDRSKQQYYDVLAKAKSNMSAITNSKGVHFPVQGVQV